MDKFSPTKMKGACGGCPFKRINNNEKPNPGGSHPFVYLGQTRGPFWLPCHNDKNYKGKLSRPENVRQCGGAAIFRSNCGKKRELPKQLLDLPENHEDVFSSEAEFFAFYTEISIEAAEALLSQELLEGLLMRELEKVGVTRLS